MRIKHIFLSALTLLSLIFGAGVSLNAKNTQVKADSAVSLGEFTISKLNTVEVFGAPTNPNHMVFMWVGGTDYPDLDGDGSEPRQLDASLVDPITNFSTHFLMDGAEASIISGQSYMNMWQRHPVFTFMPAGNGNASTFLIKKGMRIPSYSYIKGGAESYYEADKNYLFNRVGTSTTQAVFNEWSLEDYDPKDCKIEKVQSYVDNGNEFLTLTLNAPELDYPRINGSGNFHFGLGNVDELLPNFKDKVKLFDKKGDELVYDFANLLTIDLWTNYPTVSIGLDLLPQARKITIESGLVLPSYARYINDSSSQVYDGYVSSTSLSLTLDDSLEHITGSALDWAASTNDLGKLTLKSMHSQNPFGNANEFLMFEFNEQTDFYSVGSLKWDSTKYSLLSNFANKVELYDSDGNSIDPANILDVYYTYYGIQNSISVMVAACGTATKLVLKEGLLLPSYAMYSNNVSSEYYGYYTLGNSYTFKIETAWPHNSGDYIKWALPSCSLEFYLENGDKIDSYTTKAECGSLFTLPAPYSRIGYDAYWTVIEPTGLEVTNNTLSIPESEMTIKLKMAYSLRTFYLSFEGVDDVKEVHYGEKIGPLPPVPEIEGKIGVWMIGEEVLSEDYIYAFAENKTAVASYSDKTITISFNVGGGEELESLQIVFGQEINELPTPSKEGYVFDGWYLDETLETAFEYGSMATSDLVLFAKWVKSVTVTFDTDGGSLLDPVMLKKGDLLIAPNTPTKRGYTFVEWTLNGKKFDFFAPIEEDITLVAKWRIDENIEEPIEAEDDTSNKPNVGLLVGIIAGGVVLAAGIVALVILLTKRK